MPLRILEASVPNDQLDFASDLLKDVRIVQLWKSVGEEGQGLVRVLLDARESEQATDLLAGRFGSREDFRVVLMSVEATLPSVEEPGEPAPDEMPGTVTPEKSPLRISREELYEDISQASRLTRVYVVMVALSTVVAAVGLIRGDLAIIIGAMVIAPLLGPNVALPLASVLGDGNLARQSLKAIGAGVGTAALAALVMGMLLPVDPSTPMLASRTVAGVGDIFLALAAGAAGSLAFTSGVPAVVVGVMVAVALLPPLVAAGLLAGAGYGGPAMGAMLLVATNVTCVNLAAIATFFLQKVRPRTFWEADRARRATRAAMAVWIVLLFILLALILFGKVGEVGV